MICKNCKKEISDNAEYCPHCGFETDKNGLKKKVPTGKIAITAVCFVFVCLAVFLAGKIISQKNLANLSTAPVSLTSVTEDLTRTAFTQTNENDETAGIKSNNILLSASCETFPAFGIENQIRAVITAEKSQAQALSGEEFSDFCSNTIENGNYAWVTVSFSDSTGIVFVGNNTDLISYGQIDENGLIVKPYGYIIRQSDSSYVYKNILQNETGSTAQASAEESEKEPEASAETEASVKASTESLSQTAADESSQTVYVTASGTKYHKAGCSYIKNSSTASAVSKDKAVEQGYTPCSRCKP
ncbi:MAG: zinc-ribbon domain-containing protein [Acutalibacteraceae bacterium]